MRRSNLTAAIAAAMAAAAPALHAVTDRAARRNSRPAVWPTMRNEYAATRRAMKQVIGSRQLKKIERAQRAMHAARRAQVEHVQPDDTEGGATD